MRCCPSWVILEESFSSSSSANLGNAPLVARSSIEWRIGETWYGNAGWSKNYPRFVQKIRIGAFVAILSKEQQNREKQTFAPPLSCSLSLFSFTSLSESWTIISLRLFSTSHKKKLKKSEPRQSYTSLSSSSSFSSVMTYQVRRKHLMLHGLQMFPPGCPRCPRWMRLKSKKRSCGDSSRMSQTRYFKKS